MPSIYQGIVSKCGWKNAFILSAGWGLIRSDYLTPYYDITFSSQGKPWSRRGQRDHYKDFAQLQASDISPDETVYLFACGGYLRLYYSLTQNLEVRKVIYGRQGNHEGYEYIPFPTYRNWHYSCARDFIEDKIPK
jgi:hypothetical protein